MKILQIRDGVLEGSIPFTITEHILGLDMEYTVQYSPKLIYMLKSDYSKLLDKIYSRREEILGMCAD